MLRFYSNHPVSTSSALAALVQFSQINDNFDTSYGALQQQWRLEAHYIESQFQDKLIQDQQSRQLKREQEHFRLLQKQLIENLKA